MPTTFCIINALPHKKLNKCFILPANFYNFNNSFHPIKLVRLNMQEQELEQKLENIFSAVLEMLRGVWDVHHATHILLSLVFHKRLICLIEENRIDFLHLQPDTFARIAQLRHQVLPNPEDTLHHFRDTLSQLILQNKALSYIFQPLLDAFQKSEELDHLWQVIQIMHEFDFSTRQFSIPTFGRFFHTTLYRAAMRSGKSGNDVTTPPFINRLLAALAQPKRGEIVYDPSVGQGNTFIEFLQHTQRLQFIGQEMDFNVWAICQMNLWTNGVYNADILCQNALLETPYDFPPADIGVGHFPFGLTLDAQGVKDLSYLAIPFSIGTTPTLDGNSLFIQRLVYQLNENGRAVVVLPLQVTYKERADRRLREFMVRRDWLECVIALPAGMLYATGAPICIWIIRKKKSPERRRKVLFINASAIETQQKSRLYKTLQEDQIQAIAQAYEHGTANDGAYLSENVEWVSIDEIGNTRYNLNPKQYASPFIQRFKQLKATQQLVALNTIANSEAPYMWFDATNAPHRQLPFVTSADLATTFAEYQLLLDLLKTTDEYPNMEGRLLVVSALLVNTENKKLRISYFEYKGTPIVVAKDILVFEVNEQAINIEYLLLQLHSLLFLEQINLYKSDHEETGLSEREFAHLEIVMLERTLQDKQVRETKIRLLREEENKVELMRHRLNVGKQKAQNEQYRIISSLQHELGNRLPAILTEFKNLKDFIYDKVDSGEPMRLEEPIFPMFDDEDDLVGVDTVAHILQRVEALLRNTIGTLDATGSIIKADKSHLHLEFVHVKTFLQEVASLYAQERRFAIQVEAEEDGYGNELSIGTFLDKAQMTTALVNFIENAKRHGFVEDKKYTIRFRVGLSPDGQEVVIEYQNDGRPFPPSFSFDNFISYGDYAGETGHSGIGGYLISQIIDNHDGTLAYRESIERSDPFKVQFEISLPHRR